MIGETLTHRGGNMVTQQANESRKPRPEKVTVLPARSPVGVTRLSMIAYAPTALSGYDCCIAFSQCESQVGVAR